MLISPLFARTNQHRVFPATHDSIPAENRRADTLGLKRYERMRDVTVAVQQGALVLLTVPCAAKLPKDRRYALPETVAFTARLDQEFYAMTGIHLVLDSAVRPADVQKRLSRFNRSAAPAYGAGASSHERGTTVDLSRRMRKGQYRWLVMRLAYYKALGAVLIIEERSCIHVFVGLGDQGPPSELPIAGVESVETIISGLLVEREIPVQPGRSTASALPEE